jgi:hypothetical protein
MAEQGGQVDPEHLQLSARLVPVDAAQEELAAGADDRLVTIPVREHDLDGAVRARDDSPQPLGGRVREYPEASGTEETPLLDDHLTRVAAGWTDLIFGDRFGRSRGWLMGDPREDLVIGRWKGPRLCCEQGAASRALAGGIPASLTAGRASGVGGHGRVVQSRQGHATIGIIPQMSGAAQSPRWPDPLECRGRAPAPIAATRPFGRSSPTTPGGRRG